MFLSTMFKRLPKKPLLAAAALALALSLGAGRAGTHAAHAAQQYAAIEFYGIQFDAVDDGTTSCGPDSWPFCPTDTHAEVYANFAAAGTSGGYFARNLAGQGSQPGWCGSVRDWYASTAYGPCFKDVDGGLPGYPAAWTYTYRLGDAAVCTTPSRGAACSGSYQTNNNVIRMVVKPGDVIHVALTAKDYDWGSADDVLCNINATLNPFASGSGQYSLHSPWNGDGECHVLVNVSTYYA